MKKSVKQAAGDGIGGNRTPRRTDGTKYFTPEQIAERWGWHVESVRRALRQRRMAYVVISRRLLVPIAEVERVEAEGHIARAA